MARYIDADELPKAKFHDLPYEHITPPDLKGMQTEAYEEGWNDAIDAIVECAETVDAVSVVRCKDCEYRNGDYCHHPRLYGNSMFVRDDGFCDKGERRDDG